MSSLTHCSHAFLLRLPTPCAWQFVVLCRRTRKLSRHLRRTSDDHNGRRKEEGNQERGRQGWTDGVQCRCYGGMQWHLFMSGWMSRISMACTYAWDEDGGYRTVVSSVWRISTDNKFVLQCSMNLIHKSEFWKTSVCDKLDPTCDIYSQNSSNLWYIFSEFIQFVVYILKIHPTCDIYSQNSSNLWYIFSKFIQLVIYILKIHPTCDIYSQNSSNLWYIFSKFIQLVIYILKIHPTCNIYSQISSNL